MPNNYPYERWYWNDWFASTAILTIQTKGVWHELLGRMFLDDRNYFIDGTESELARLAGCEPEQIREAVTELSKRKIADVTFCYNNVTGLLHIECRRLKKEYSERKRASIGMQKTRESRKSYADVTDTRARNQYPITNNHIIKEEVKEESEPKADEPPPRPYPKTVEEVLAIAHSPQCAIPMTSEQAEKYLIHRNASDWVDVVGRKVKLENITWDLKKWYNNDKNHQNEAKHKSEAASKPAAVNHAQKPDFSGTKERNDNVEEHF